MVKPFSAAAERNRIPIGEVLERVLPESCNVLEIGAGTGQHALYFCSLRPAWRWLPSEHPDALEMLRHELVDHGADNLESPIALDVAGEWPERRFDAVYSANTAHIMPIGAVEAMFRGVGGHLSETGRFVLYGPFKRGGRHQAPSNADFDAGLRRRDPAMGIRDLSAIDAMADSSGLTRIAELALPVNNHILIFEKICAGSGS